MIARFQRKVVIPAVEYPVYPVGESPIEKVMFIPPISDAILQNLSTIEHLSIRNSSRLLRQDITQNYGLFQSLVLVRPGVVWGDDLQLSQSKQKPKTQSDISIQEAEIDRRARAVIDDHFLGDLYKQNFDKVGIDLIADMFARHGDLSSKWLEKLIAINKNLAELTSKISCPSLVIPSSLYYPRLMGRHVYQMLNSLSLGRNVTTLILDGSGIDSKWIQFLLIRFQASLRWLSVRHCAKLELGVIVDWLLGGMYKHFPFQLRLLRVRISTPLLLF
jgi:hypothetical protein